MAQTALGSVDMGNVSRVVPAIHPYLMLGKGTDVPHTKGFCPISRLGEWGETTHPGRTGPGFDRLGRAFRPRLFAKIRREFEREVNGGLENS